MKRLGVPTSELRIENGTIKGGGKSASYAELVGGGTFSLKIDKRCAAERPSDLHDCWQVRAASRYSGKGDWTLHVTCTISASPECCTAAWSARWQ